MLDAPGNTMANLENVLHPGNAIENLENMLDTTGKPIENYKNVLVDTMENLECVGSTWECSK
jgi:hypothetical protein